MDVKRFIRYCKDQEDDYTFAEAAEYLEVTQFTLTRFMKSGIIKPSEGGGRGNRFYFKIQDVVDLRAKIEEFQVQN